MLAHKLRKAAGFYRADAVTFDGSNDYLTRGGGLTGAADGKAGLVSIWFDIGGSDGATQVVFRSEASGVLRFNVDRQTTNVIRVQGRNTANTNILVMDTASTIVAATGWVHLLASWNLAATTGHLYINGVSDLAGGSTLTNDTIDHTVTAWTVGAADAAGVNKFTGDMADLWFQTSYLDITSAANRALFRDSGGRPVRPSVAVTALGEPLVRLSGPLATWATNQGTGGGFTTNGALATASTSPSN